MTGVPGDECTTLIHLPDQYSLMRTFSRLARIVLVVALLFLVATATAATGTIQINIHPGGGTVCLDTDCRENPVTAEETGSITFENVETGCYHMVNVYGTKGYEPWLGQIYLDLSTPSVTRDINLKALSPSPPQKAAVRVFVTPDGGKVCLDRMCELSSGDGTGSWSVQFTDIAANTNHTLTIAHEGYGTWTTEVRLLPGQTSSLSVALEPLPPGESPSPTTVPPPTTEPAPTQAGLPVWFVPLAIGISVIAWVLKGRGQE